MDSPISVGKASTPTPTGTFTVYSHWEYFDGGDGFGQIGGVVAAQGDTHEVVVAVALEGSLECHLVDDEVLDERNLILHGVLTAVERVVGHGQLVEGVGLAVAGAQGVDAEGGLLGERVGIEGDELSGLLLLEAVDVVDDILRAESVLQDGECRLRQSCAVESLCIAQVDHRAAIGDHAVLDNLIDGLSHDLLIVR